MEKMLTAGTEQTRFSDGPAGEEEAEDHSETDSTVLFTPQESDPGTAEHPRC